MELKVLVTNYDYKNSLAAVKALGKEGIEIAVCGHQRGFRARTSSYSKYCSGWGIYNNPIRNARKFVCDLINILKKNNCSVLMPIGVDTTLPVSYYKDKLSCHSKVPVADYNIMSTAHDKSKTLRIARQIGIPIPETYYPKSINDIKKITSITFPVIIKRRKGSGVRDGIKIAKSKHDLIKKYIKMNNTPSDSLVNEHRFPIVQEFIPGEIRDVCAIFNNGQPRGALAQRRILMYPPQGGVGIVNETINDPNLIKMAVKLLKEIKWHGVAQVEFKLDDKGRPRLMEINPKFWGTLELSIVSGINFPYMLYKIAKEGDVSPCFRYLKSVQFWWVAAHFPQIILTFINNRRDFLKTLSKNIYKKIDLSIDIKPNIIQLFNGMILLRRFNYLVNTPYTESFIVKN